MTTYYPFSTYKGFEIKEPNDPDKPWMVIAENGNRFFVEGDCREWIDNAPKGRCPNCGSDQRIWHEWGTKECVVCRLIQNA
jgi:hypothetical protein